jgi:8-oxo-dGTP pyrophosphatase MutT (NUDIX family)
MSLAEKLALFKASDPQEERDLETIREFVSRHRDPFDRRIREGHLTGSALVVTASGEKVVLLQHRKLHRWLQPGGHAEPGEDRGEVVALREAREETGIASLVLHPKAPRPLDVDVHLIPARRDEPAHAHLDLRYLVLAPEGARMRPLPGETRNVRFFSWDELPSLGLDPGLVRALGKARTILGVPPS